MFKFIVVENWDDVPKEYRLFLELKGNDFVLKYRHFWKENNSLGNEMEVCRFEFQPKTWKGKSTYFTKEDEEMLRKEELDEDYFFNRKNPWMNEEMMFSYIKETIQNMTLLNPADGTSLKEGTVYLFPYWEEI